MEIEEAIEKIKDVIYVNDKVHYECINLSNCPDNECEEFITAIETILTSLEKKDKEIDCLKNHIHYKKCIACGKEFRAKRSDAKYCTYCGKFENNRNYYLNLTEEQKAKRRDQSKLSMRKIREREKQYFEDKVEKEKENDI